MSNPHWLLFVLISGASCVFSQSYTHGTTIAAIRTNEAVFIVADSRSLAIDGTKQPDACKIIPAGNYYFAIHGFKNETILDSISRTLIGPEKTFAKAQTLIKLLTPIIERSGPPLGVGDTSGVDIVDVENGAPLLVHERFWPRVDNPIVMCPPTCRNNGELAVSVSPSWPLPSGSFKRDSISSAARTFEDARNFVLSQISKGDELERKTGRTSPVGAPIQSLIFYASGQHVWPDKPEICKDEP